jgi:hypothetical protein
MWTRKLKTCFAAVGLLTAATLAGCVVDDEHKILDEIQSKPMADSICDGLDQQACWEHRDTCVQIWRVPAGCENAELCDPEFVLCSALGG